MNSYQSFNSSLPATAKISTYKIGSHYFTTALEDLTDSYKVTIASTLPNLILHWGIGLTKPKDWINPSSFNSIKLPPLTETFNEKAVQSPFTQVDPNLSRISLEFFKPVEVLQLNFVLKSGNQWHNNNSNDYSIVFKEPELPQALKGIEVDLQQMLQEIIDAETSGNAWTLMLRFNLCNKWLQRLSNVEALSYIFIWMRFSALRKLDWQRKQNTRPSELSKAQKILTFTLTNLLRNKNPEGLINSFTLIRLTLSHIGTASENGQRIRDEILQILHKGGIRHNLPKFGKINYYEQWHQKLHNNTTPDDIGICEAVIAFNETQRIDKYWEVLARHGLSAERLRSFDRPITVEPFLAPQIVPDLYGYLDLLKAVHGSVQLSNSIKACKDFVSPGVNAKLQRLSEDLTHWDKISLMEAALEIRLDLQGVKNLDETGYREIVYLDIALEGFMRQLCEDIVHLDIEIQYLCKELRILLQGIFITARSPELDATFEDFQVFSEDFEKSKNSVEKALILKSSCDRIQRTLIDFVDNFTKLIDSKSRYLGSAFKIDDETLNIFTEECIRGSLFFAVSLALKKLDSQLRKLCGLRPFQVISPQSPIKGKILKIQSLSEVAYTKYTSPVILICSAVSGEEEIPENVSGVICKSDLDTLAHVSVRARNSKTFLAVCHSEEEFENLTKSEGLTVELSLTGTGVKVTEIQEILTSSLEETKVREVQRPQDFEKITVMMKDFHKGLTGAKANNCLSLLKSLPKNIGVPASAALPFGSFEHVLSYNPEIEAEISALLSADPYEISYKINLEQVQSKVLLLALPDFEETEIKSLLRSLEGTDTDWHKAWTAIKRVWASKYNERVHLSRLKSHIDLSQICMSVLCQVVISGDYAFVLHTMNPITNNPEEIYGEIVKGLGETLVGAYAGRALSFTVNKINSTVKIESFFNKSIMLVGGGLIFRSDSNCEDLPGFAGAGLFDSFVMDKPESYVVRYSHDKLLCDQEFRLKILSGLKDVGMRIEQVFNNIAQDIEGVIKEGEIFVVQSRPQV